MDSQRGSTRFWKQVWAVGRWLASTSNDSLKLWADGRRAVGAYGLGPVPVLGGEREGLYPLPQGLYGKGCWGGVDSPHHGS